jgi:MSHA biogenesis protein MshO
MAFSDRHLRRQRGFTMVELIMVIVIMGVIGGIVSVFMKSPIDAYFASARRAALTDESDTAVRRVARDIRKALPNSIHAPNTNCVEFIPTKTGGRYRADVDSSSGAPLGDILDFDVADSSFDMLGANSSLPDQTIVVGDVVAVYSLGQATMDAYAGDNVSAVTSVGAGALSNETHIGISSKKFPNRSPGQHFHVIPSNEKVVAFVCSGGKLFRTANTSIAKTTSGSACAISGAGMSAAILANNVNSCGFVYDPDDQRDGLVQLRITFTNGGESMAHYHEVHVNNTP